MKNYKESFNNYVSAESKMREDINEFLISALEQLGGSTEFNDDDEDEELFILYDGGRHSEYAVDFVKVTGVRLEGNSVYAMLEDGEDDYSMDRITNDYLYSLACAVDSKLS